MKNLQFTIYNLQFKVILSFIVICLLFILSSSISADVAGDDDFVYLFHLYYDNDRLFADRDFEFKYDVIPEKFTPEAYNTQFPFRGEIVNFKNEVAEEFRFDPRRGNPAFLEGKIEVKAPYVSDGQKAVFYDSQGRTLLTIFVSESSFCNDDGVCNADRGEDYLACPNDCKPLPTTPTPGSEHAGGKGMPISTWALIIGAVAALGAGGWYGWKRYKERSSAVDISAVEDFASPGDLRSR
jgi:hypothetical protein